MERPAEVTTPARQRPSAPLLWRCPQCGFLLTPQPTTVRCPRCGENLRKCRYCKFADTVTWECTNARIRSTFGDELVRFHIPEPDHVWACPENLPALQPYFWQTVWREAMANPLTRGLVWGAMAAVVLLLAFRYAVLPFVFPRPAPESALVTARVIVQREKVELGEPVPVLILVTNAEEIPLEPCLIFLRGSLARDSEISSNPPQLPLPLREGVQLRFPGLQPGQAFPVWLTFTPLARGRRTYDLKVDVYCGGYRAIVTPPGDFRVEVR